MNWLQRSLACVLLAIFALVSILPAMADNSMSRSRSINWNGGAYYSRHNYTANYWHHRHHHHHRHNGGIVVRL
jgi:hypothetical protein